jgi:hypothetical protein
MGDMGRERQASITVSAIAALALPAVLGLMPGHGSAAARGGGQHADHAAVAATPNLVCCATAWC